MKKPKIANATGHSLNFQDMSCQSKCKDGPGIQCDRCPQKNIYTIPSSGLAITAETVTIPAGYHINGKRLINIKFMPTKKGHENLKKIKAIYSDPDLVIVGSIIAAQAFPGEIVAPKPVPGFERVNRRKQRARDDEFITFE